MILSYLILNYLILCYLIYLSYLIVPSLPYLTLPYLTFSYLILSIYLSIYRSTYASIYLSTYPIRSSPIYQEGLSIFHIYVRTLGITGGIWAISSHILREKLLGAQFDRLAKFWSSLAIGTQTTDIY